jgi:hypothetical protein
MLYLYDKFKKNDNLNCKIINNQKQRNQKRKTTDNASN